MRDKIVANPSAYPFESFFIPYTTTYSMNWPYPPGECLLDHQNRPLTNGADLETLVKSVDDSEDFSINPVFESHLRKIENWSLGPAFRNTFPDLVEGIPIR